MKPGLLFLLFLLVGDTMPAADTQALARDLKIRQMEGRFDRYFDPKPMTEAEKDAEVESMRQSMLDSQLAKGEEDTEQRRRGRDQFLAWVRESKGKPAANPYRYKLTVGANGVLCQYIAQKGGSLVEGGVSWCLEREGLMYEYSEGSEHITIRKGTPDQTTVLGVMLAEMGLLGQADWISRIADGISTQQAAADAEAGAALKLAVKWPYGHGDILRHPSDARLVTGMILHTGSADFPQLVNYEFGQFFKASDTLTLPGEMKYSYKGPQSSHRSVITLEKLAFVKEGEKLPEVELPTFGIVEVADVSHMGPGQGEVRYKAFGSLPTHDEVQKLRLDPEERKRQVEKMDWLKKAQQSVPGR
ncbi:hypothetical protein [Verrucomicrobium sp. BvORR034]|uniref:hypothetical protein n=1 Tax=Verrucomicrobium sp. BvORR034 TaxID=1396418 RepID=UPI0006799452|nr:hypothetical protein [Verrucomicrobium sp. BvORR034]